MKRIGILIVLGILAFSVIYPSVQASDAGVIIEQQLVTISVADKGLRVEEDITVNNTGAFDATSLRFWIQQNAQDISILAVQSGKQLTPLIAGNIQECNLSAVNLSLKPATSMDIQLTYFIPANAESFEKTLLYDTTRFSVTYNDQVLFQGKHLLYSSESTNSIQISLYKPTEAPLGMVTLLVIFIIAVVIIASLLLLLKKRRSKIKSSISESEETLTTKKALLLSLLKDLEKQYRAQSISGETYNKLKEEYKQQAVDAMKKLDDIKK